MSTAILIADLYIFSLATLLGLQVILRVPKLLHTPLMSLTNAISAIAVVGSIVIAGAHETTYALILGCVAVTCSTINVVGGYLITDRMLRMFKPRQSREAKPAGASAGKVTP